MTLIEIMLVLALIAMLGLWSLQGWREHQQRMQLEQQVQRLRIYLTGMQSMAYEEILHGRAEVAVITLAPEPHNLVRATRVWDDPLDFVVAPEHSLISNGSVSLADIAGHPAVFPGGNTFTHHIVSRLFEAQGLTPNIAMSTNYLETIKMMVSIGLAWSVLPRTMLDDQVASIALPGIQLSRQLGYIVHTERTLSNAARAFMSLLDAQVDPAGMPA